MATYTKVVGGDALGVTEMYGLQYCTNGTDTLYYIEANHTYGDEGIKIHQYNITTKTRTLLLDGAVDVPDFQFFNGLTYFKGKLYALVNTRLGTPYNWVGYIIEVGTRTYETVLTLYDDVLNGDIGWRNGLFTDGTYLIAASIGGNKNYVINPCYLKYSTDGSNWSTGSFSMNPAYHDYDAAFIMPYAVYKTVYWLTLCTDAPVDVYHCDRYTPFKFIEGTLQAMNVSSGNNGVNYAERDLETEVIWLDSNDYYTDESITDFASTSVDYGTHNREYNMPFAVVRENYEDAGNWGTYVYEFDHTTKEWALLDNILPEFNGPIINDNGTFIRMNDGTTYAINSSNGNTNEVDTLLLRTELLDPVPEPAPEITETYSPFGVWQDGMYPLSFTYGYAQLFLGSFITLPETYGFVGSSSYFETYNGTYYDITGTYELYTYWYDWTYNIEVPNWTYTYEGNSIQSYVDTYGLTYAAVYYRRTFSNIRAIRWI